MSPFVIVRRPSLSLVVALVALLVALCGTGYAAVQLPKDSVGAKQIEKGAVKSAEVKNRSLRSEDFAAGVIPRPTPGLGNPQPWQALSMGSGWQAYGPGFTFPQFRVDQLGQVHVRGLVTKASGVPATSDLIAVLPTGFRPVGRQHFAVAMGTLDGPGTVIVDPDGGLRWLAGPNGGTDYTDLTGLSFWTD